MEGIVRLISSYEEIKQIYHQDYSLLSSYHKELSNVGWIERNLKTAPIHVKVRFRISPSSIAGDKNGMSSLMAFEESATDLYNSQ